MNSQFYASEHEKLIIETIRQARANRKRPSTFVIRVVDGIVQVMVAQPTECLCKSSDICQVDYGNGNR